MLNVIINLLEKHTPEKFILFSGFTNKDEIIAYLKNEYATPIPLTLEPIFEISHLLSKLNYITAYSGDDLILLNPGDIYFMEASLRKTKLFTEKGEFLSSKPLNYYEKKLLAMGFFRSHKSFLINISKVERCTLMVNYNYEVYFRNIDHKAEISRNNIKRFKKIIEL